MKDVAQSLGVSHVTVSLALRNHPSIPPSTRLKVRQAARQLGYRPDPMLSALNSYRNQTSHRPAYQATLAWINAHPDRKALSKIEAFRAYRLGAESRAAELGFAIEEFWIHEPELTFPRLSRILRSRQIQGILLPPMPHGHVRLDLPWENLSTVQFGFSHEPLFHLVTNAQFRSARLLVRSLYERGYRNIGFVCPVPWEETTDSNFSAGYLTEISKCKLKPQLLSIASNSYTGTQAKQILRWVREKTPDVIISMDIRLIEMLEQNGYPVPHKQAVAMVNCSSNQSERAGIDQHPLVIGRTALEQLAAMIHHNERGIPEHPLRILVESTWVEGASAPGRNSTSPLPYSG